MYWSKNIQEAAEEAARFNRAQLTNTQIISNLWQELRQAINKAYAANTGTDDLGCLRDYTENISWPDSLAALLGRETANERQHRSNRPAVPSFGANAAAKLILMHNVAAGAKMTEMPKATAFLVMRQTAVEAEVIGWLIRTYLDLGWLDAVERLDYAELMKG